MPRSRTVRTLTALFAAMIAGALLLMLMETEPLRPSAEPLTAHMDDPYGANKAVFNTYQGFDRLKWRNVVIHATPMSEVGQMGDRCHFLVGLDASGNPVVMTTQNWRNQIEGRHISVPNQNYDAISVGVCIIADFSKPSPLRGSARKQYHALVAVVKQLQQEFGIASDHVYLHSDLVPGSNSPGPAFPVKQFERDLARN